MAAMIAAVVWLVLYPYEHDNDTFSHAQITNLTSLTMHAANLAFMLIEFALDGAHTFARTFRRASLNLCVAS